MPKDRSQEPPREYGLFQVHPDPKLTDETSKTKLEYVLCKPLFPATSKYSSIIALHGLGARSPKTWLAWKDEEDKLSGDVNWLSDEHMLPSKIPDARIMTYDWNGDYDTAASTDRFQGLADTLLDRIYVNREATGKLEVPLILIASCFGGLLAAKALVRAAEQTAPREARNRTIIDSIIGIITLGTPFGGSWEAGRKSAAMRVAVAALAAAEENISYTNEFIQYLQKWSTTDPGPLDELVQKFSEVMNHAEFRIPVSCFYETRHSKFSGPLSNLDENFRKHTGIDENGHGIVVTQDSACLPGADRVGLDLRHNMLHKFNSPSSDGFTRICSTLLQFVEKAEGTLRQKQMARFQRLLDIAQDPAPQSGDLATLLNKGVINEWPQAMHYEEMTRRLLHLEQGWKAPGTCEWLLQTDEFKLWQSEDMSAQRVPLILRGKPGCGKSVLLQSTLTYSQSQATGATYLHYFFDGTNGTLLQKSSLGLYRSLIYQTLQKSKTSRNILELLNSWGNPRDAVHDAGALRPKFFQLVRTLLDRVNIFIDALDECKDGEEIKDFLDACKELLKSKRNIRLCLSARNTDELKSYLGSISVVSVDERNRDDIKTYVEARLRELDRPQLRSRLLRVLPMHSSNVFMWVKLVIDLLNKSAYEGNSDRKVEEMIHQLPTELETLYDSLLRKLDTHRLAEAIMLLQLTHVAMRPLRMTEVQSALQNANSARGYENENIIGMSSSNFDQRIQALCPGLVELKTQRIRPGKPNDGQLPSLAEIEGWTETWIEEFVVQFTHQSVRDYLSQSKRREISPGHTLVSTAEAHLKVAKLCMHLYDTKSEDDPFWHYATQFWTAHGRKGDSAVDRSFQPPTFVLECDQSTRWIYQRFKKCCSDSILDNLSVDGVDFTHAEFLGIENSLLVLLAFEGCTQLIARHGENCEKVKDCVGSPEVLERALFWAVSRGWIDAIRAVRDVAKRRSIVIDLTKAQKVHKTLSQTPMEAACYFGLHEIVELLLAMDRSVIDETNPPEYCPLHTAVQYGHLQVVTVILTHAQKCNKIKEVLEIQDRNGFTVFHQVAATGQWLVFRKLTEHIKGLEYILNIKSRKMSTSLTALDVARVSLRGVFSNTRVSLGVKHAEHRRVVQELEAYAESWKLRS